MDATRRLRNRLGVRSSGPEPPGARGWDRRTRPGCAPRGVDSNAHARRPGHRERTANAGRRLVAEMTPTERDFILTERRERLSLLSSAGAVGQRLNTWGADTMKKDPDPSLLDEFQAAERADTGWTRYRGSRQGSGQVRALRRGRRRGHRRIGRGGPPRGPGDGRPRQARGHAHRARRRSRRARPRKAGRPSGRGARSHRGRTPAFVRQGASAAGPVRDGRKALPMSDARDPEDERSSATMDQLLSDADQAVSDADQALSDVDQASSDADQRISDRDQAIADAAHRRRPGEPGRRGRVSSLAGGSCPRFARTQRQPT